MRLMVGTCCTVSGKLTARYDAPKQIMGHDGRREVFGRKTKDSYDRKK